MNEKSSISLFNEYELEEISKNRKKSIMLDSEGLPAKKVSYDTSYLITCEEVEKLFNETVLEVIKKL